LGQLLSKLFEDKMKNNIDHARKLDLENPLRDFRNKFFLPKQDLGTIYFTGHSLGPMPKLAKDYVVEELDYWAKLGLSGHYKEDRPWKNYDDNLLAPFAGLVGSLEKEVGAMNGLTVNLHLLMVSFYRPNSKKFKILIENNAFSSDQYAVDSQVRFHGFDPKEAIIELCPKEGKLTLDENYILETIEKYKDELALILIGNVNYLSGQAFDVKTITALANKFNIPIGFDLAHGTGNLEFDLHDDGVDFAVWCTYKYLNCGPGSLGGFYIHDKHLKNKNIPRFEGWFGNKKETRFLMNRDFEPMDSVQSWQLSNPGIFQLASMRASMEIFEQATMPKIRKVGDQLTGYLESLLKENCPKIEVITPSRRGSMLSLKYQGDTEGLFNYLVKKKIEVDLRRPNILRLTPAPLYNTFEEVFKVVEIISNYKS
jgi:kynureninase